MLLLTEIRVVSHDEGQLRAKEHKILFFECSAKEGTNVKEIFRNIAAALPGGGKPTEGMLFKLLLLTLLLEVLTTVDLSAPETSTAGTSASTTTGNAGWCSCGGQ